MKNTFTLKKIFLAILTFVIIISCERNSSYENSKPSIANIAVTNPDFSTLESAAVLGGVAGVLSNLNPGDASGKYTVFAPTNAAFDKLPKGWRGTILRVLTSENQEEILEVLQN